jgi:serine/threonine protein kinase
MVDLDEFGPQTSSEIFIEVEKFVKDHNINIIPLKALSISEELGSGAQGKVFFGLYENKKVALKLIEEVDLKCLKNEIEISSKVCHPHIPKFYGMMLEDNNIGIVIEFIEGRTLDEVDLSLIPFNRKIEFMKQLCSAVNYLHSLNFIHRDLKPENLLIQPDTLNLYVIDFGIAKIIDEEFGQTRAKGTIHYLPPETFDVVDTNKYDEIITLITTKVDVWSIGCIASYLFSGKLPWCNLSILSKKEITRKLLKKEAFPIPSSIIDPDIIKLIEVSTITDYNKRASVSEVSEILNNF